jgi:defect-in-organelle-trafficking protein DotC
MQSKFIPVLVALSLSCSANAANSLRDLQELGGDKLSRSTNSTENMRYTALKNTAIGLGTRGGLAARSAEINAELERKANQLNKVYNFRMLMISLPAGTGAGSKGTTDYMVLPPVIRQSHDVYQLDSDTRIRLADAEYEIVSQARFVSAPPTWRDYLYLPEAGVEDMPHPTMTPKNDEERKLWRQWVQQGWKLGSEQADAILQENLLRLQRDFGGIVKYRELLAEGKVTRPFVAQNDVGVTGGGNDMAIGERVLRITSTSRLNADESTWKPIVRGH